MHVFRTFWKIDFAPVEQKKSFPSIYFSFDNFFFIGAEKTD